MAAERMAFAANALPALIAYVDTAVRYVWVNEGYRRWFGSRPRSVIGRHPREVLDACRRGPKSNRTWSGHSPARRSRSTTGWSEDGVTRDVRVVYVPHRDDSGRVRGFVALVTDISEMKHVEGRAATKRADARAVAGDRAGGELGGDLRRRAVRRCPAARSGRARPTASSGTSPVPRPAWRCSTQRVHPDDRAAFHAPDGPRHRGVREPFETEYRIVRPDGGVRMIACLAPLRARAGRHNRARSGPARTSPSASAPTWRSPRPRAAPARRRRDARLHRPLRPRPAAGLGQQELRRALRQEPDELVGNRLVDLVGERPSACSIRCARACSAGRRSRSSWRSRTRRPALRPHVVGAHPRRGRGPRRLRHGADRRHRTGAAWSRSASAR